MAITSQPTIDDLSVAQLKLGFELLGHATSIKAVLALRHSSEPLSVKRMGEEFGDSPAEVGRLMREMTERRYVKVAGQSEKRGKPANFYALTPRGTKLYDRLISAE